VQMEDGLAAAEAVEKKAAEVGAPISQAERDLMADLKRFFASRRHASDTMVAAATEVAGRSPGAPTALVIGAAHTAQVCRLFEQRQQPFVLIAPQTTGPDDRSQLSARAFARKGLKLSVDEGQLAALLDGRDAKP